MNRRNTGDNPVDAAGNSPRSIEVRPRLKTRPVQEEKKQRELDDEELYEDEEIVVVRKRRRKKKEDEEPRKGRQFGRKNLAEQPKNEEAAATDSQDKPAKRKPPKLGLKSTDARLPSPSAGLLKQAAEASPRDDQKAPDFDHTSPSRNRPRANAPNKAPPKHSSPPLPKWGIALASGGTAAVLVLVVLFFVDAARETARADRAAKAAALRELREKKAASHPPTTQTQDALPDAENPAQTNESADTNDLITRPVPTSQDALADNFASAWFQGRAMPESPQAAAREAAEFVRFINANPPSSTALVVAVEEAVRRYGFDPDLMKGALVELDPLFRLALAKIETNGQSALLHYHVGQAFTVAGRHDAATKEFEISLAGVPRFEPAARALFSLHGMLGRTGEQIAAGYRLLAIAPDAALLTEMLRLLDEANRTNEALDMLDGHPSIVLDHPDLAIRKVQLMRMAENSPGELLDAFASTVKLHADNQSVRVFQLILLDAAGRTDAVAKAVPNEIVLLAEGAELGEDALWEYARTLGTLAWRSGLHDEARKAYELVIARGDGHAAEAANDLAYKLIKIGDHSDETLALVETALSHDSSNLAYIDTLAVLHLQRSEPAKAVRAFEDHVDVAGLNHPIAGDTLATAYEQAGRIKDAAILRSRLGTEGQPENAPDNAGQAHHQQEP